MVWVFAARYPLRHDFVHDINFKKNITKKQLDEFRNIYILFILAVDIYVNEKQREYSKKKKAALKK